MRRSISFGFLLALVLAACSGSETATTADEQFGHRYEGRAPDGRETHVILPADSTTDYAVHPAVFDTVHIRPQFELATLEQSVQVEILVKGSFPDSCTELHAVRQQRSGNIINVSLDMRRPRAELCASIVRPYRFYVILDGRYSSGNYTLKLNDDVQTFTIRPNES